MNDPKERYYTRIEGQMDKLYGYAIRHTFRREEADELSQEILLTVLREVTKLKDEEKFEPWFWGVAKNVTRHYRRKLGKERAICSCGLPEAFAEEIPDESWKEEEEEELYALLRSKIAGLSSIYRDILILFYYDGLSVKEVARRLQIPKGTVTWRLSAARNKLKKEWTNMEESVLRPQKLKIDIYGNGHYDGKTIPFPDTYLEDALSQNILCQCYEQAKSIEELSGILGVPAYYVEERMENLLRREAVRKVSGGKYRTDFVIWTDKFGLYCEETGEKAISPLLEDAVSALRKLTETADRLGIYKGGKSEDELLLLYGVLAFSNLKKKKMPSPAIREKYDGNRFMYIGSRESGAHRRISLSVNSWVWGSGEYCYQTYWNFAGFSRRPMTDSREMNVCVEIWKEGSTQDLETAAMALRDGFLSKQADGSIFLGIPAFTREQKQAFDAAAEECLEPLMPAYEKAVEDFLAGYRKLFPKHLEEQTDWLCSQIFTALYTVMAEAAIRKGLLNPPEKGSGCDLLIGQ